MGRVRVRLPGPRALAYATVCAGATITACGVWLVWGLGWGLIAAGVALTAVGLFAVDVRPAARPARRPPYAQQVPGPGRTRWSTGTDGS